MPRLHLLAISGSLRAASSNTHLLRAAMALAPADAEITLYEGIGSLPHFNPDLEGHEANTVLEFRATLRSCDALLISCPEYAHGVPGSLKNALDWLVGSGELVGRPVALLNASSRSTYAQASLLETLRVMDTRLISHGSWTIPLDGKKLDAVGILASPGLNQQLRTILLEITAAVPPPLSPE